MGRCRLVKCLEEVIIEELAAIVAIEAEQGERQRLFDLFDLFEGVGFSFSPDGPLFGPAGGNIDAINGIGEHSGEGFAAMGDGVGFEEAGVGFVPLVGFDRDLSSEQGSWFGGGSASFFILDSGRDEESIDGGCRDMV